MPKEEAVLSKGYINEQGVSSLSFEEAKTSLDELLLIRQSCQSEQSLHSQFMEEAINNLEGLVERYKADHATYRREMSSLPGPGIHRDGSENMPSRSEVTYPDKVAQPPEILKDAMEDASPVSKMDFNALSQVIRNGSISPALPNTLWPCGELRTPTPNGFIQALTLDYFEPAVGPRHRSSGNPIATVHYETKSNIVPACFGSQITSFQGNQELVEPSTEDPLLYRSTRGRGFTYQIGESPDAPKIDPAQFHPTAEESGYLRKILPVPSVLEHQLHGADPEECVHLISSLMGARQNSDSKLSAFRYVCHPQFGEFLRNNSKYLPLITSELKVGHCDVLAWYAASLMRSFGHTAWVGTVAITTPEGKAFNDAYRHSVVIFAKKDCTLAYFDPTTFCEHDKAFHPDILPAQTIQKLQSDFSGAKTNNDKVAVLKAFNTGLTPLRDTAEQNPKVVNSYMDMGNILGFLSSGCAVQHLSDTMRVRSTIVGWNCLPTTYSTENVYTVIESLLQDRGYTYLRLSEDTDGHLFYNLSKHPLARKHIAYLGQACHEMRSFSLYDTVMLSNDIRGLGIDPDPLPSHLADTLSSDSSRIRLGKAKDLRHLFKISGYNHRGTITAQSGDLTILLSSPLHKIPYSPTEFQHSYSEKTHKLLKQPDISLYNIIKESGISRNDQTALCIDFHRACTDREARPNILSRLDVDESRFKELVLMDLYLTSGDSHHIVARGLPALHPPHTDLLAVEEIMKVTPRCQARFFLALKNAIGTFREDERTSRVPEDLREYTFGEDFGRIDWNATARFGKEYVKTGPLSARTLGNPLYVYLAYDNPSFVTYHQHTLLLAGLQKIARANDIEIYVGSYTNDAYIKVNQGLSSSHLARALGTCSAQSLGKRYLPTLAAGKLPQNLLVVSDSYLILNGIRYLTEKNIRSSVKTVCLNEDPFTIFPLVQDNWIENGFSRRIQERME